MLPEDRWFRNRANAIHGADIPQSPPCSSQSLFNDGARFLFTAMQGGFEMQAKRGEVMTQQIMQLARYAHTLTGLAALPQSLAC